MISLKLSLPISMSFLSLYAFSQKDTIIPDLSKIKDTTIWTVKNREALYNRVLFVNSKSGDGLLWLNNYKFSNGTIEIDIKGKNDAGKSFVGIAFHGLTDSTFDAIYFRPFNFQNAERKNHSVQYVSEPQYPWHELREKFPGKYENTIIPVPDPDDWFHVTIIVEYPTLRVFVNNSSASSLETNQLNERMSGKIGLWVGNNSEGFFRNFRIIRNN